MTVYEQTKDMTKEELRDMIFRIMDFGGIYSNCDPKQCDKSCKRCIDEFLDTEVKE